jgi:DNA-binding CsgD family transcriptional regulator
VPLVVITSFRVFNRNVQLPAPLAEIDGLRLSYKDSFAFEFAALNFSNPQKNQYAYKLLGLHQDWLYLKNKREITFAGLEPGHYTLRVKAANNDGVWNEEGLRLAITITPPFWRTWWFMSLLALLIVGLAYRWHQRRLRWKQLLLDNEADMDHFFRRYNISRREQEIVNLILRGKDNREIEKTLFISLGTVKNHIYSIFQKVGVNNRGQLILKIINSPKKR